MNKLIIGIFLVLGSYISIGSIYILDIISIIIVISMLLYFVKNKNIISLPKKFNIIYFIFLVSISLSTIVAYRDIKGFIKWVELYFLIWGIYIIFEKYRFDEKEICEVILYSNCTGIFLSYLTLIQTGNWVSAKMITRQSIIYVIIGVLILEKNRRNNMSTKGWILILLSILLSIITKSRGNILGLVVFLGVISLNKLYGYIFKSNKIKIKNILISHILVIILIVSIRVIPNLYSPFIEILESLNFEKYKTASNVERTEMIELSIDIISKNPITGIGTGNFGEYYLGYKSDLTVHNVFLQIGVEYGVIVMIIFILMMLYISIKCFKIYNYNKYYSYIVICMLIVLYDFIISVFSGERRIILGLILTSILYVNSKENIYKAKKLIRYN